MSEFGKRTLAVWYSADHDYYTIDNVDWWAKDRDDYIMVSEPFDAVLVELDDSAVLVNAAKIRTVDAKIDEVREKLGMLKEVRANLLALPGIE
jgi:hypothetical protein